MLEFWLPMALLFLAATITAIAARRKRDRCLKYFNREPVMILMQSGKWLWGRFVAYPKAMELIFEKPEVDESGHKKASFVLYTPEVDGIKKILQPPPASGTKPMRAKACKKNALRPAQIMSPMRAKLMPTPAAAPFTAVTMGSSRSRMPSSSG